MPNDVTIDIYADRAFLNQFISANEAGEKRFDFEKIIPPPANIWYGNIEYTHIEQILDENIKRIMDAGGFNAVKKLSQSQQQEFSLTKEQVSANGYINWYDWSVANWNTKWNSYDLGIQCEDEDEDHISFCTAWDAPYPIIAALYKMNPDIECEFDGLLFSEDDETLCYGYFADGKFTFHDYDDDEDEKVFKSFHIDEWKSN